MPLSPGTRLGSYEVISRLGAGGMGEVYRARDSRLDRDVAIKVLPESFALEADRVARFVREAKTLASLNHPNIAAIYGIEESGTVRALVMELVEGEDLSRIIARGPMAFADAGPIAGEIADALEAAHEQGIIHRDLKPANIKIKADGTVKVLDFGLAKAATSADGSGSALANSPTLTAHATQMGTIIGTAAYMSPEQAKGRAVDKRADIWAFGAVLYEMLTGERAFKGDDVSETLASVIKDTPNLAALPASTPTRVRALIERCLERDVKMRLRDIGDARVELTKAVSRPAESSSPLPSPTLGATVVIPAPTRPWWRGPVGLAATFVLGVAATLAVSRPWQAPVVSHAVTRFLIPTADTPESLVLAPNGKRLLIQAGGKMFVRDFDQVVPREVAGVGPLGTGDSAPAPAWSPDSASIAYGSGGKVWRVGSAGGAPTPICDVPGVLQGLLWKPDDTIVLTLTRGPMYQVPATGGDPRVLLPLDGKDDVDFHQPSVLPDGQTLIYPVHRQEGVDTIEALSGGARRVLLRMEGRALEGPQVVNRAAYSPTGHLIYRVEQGNAGVWAQPFSLRDLKTTGEPFLIAAGASLPTLGADGTLAYTAPAPNGPRQLVIFRRDGSVERTLGVPRKLLRQPSLSPDGRRIVYVADDTNADIWVMNADGSGDTRITFTPGNESEPTWVPGENAVAFSCPTSGGGAICVKAADGTGETRVLATLASQPVFSPDGRYVLMQTTGRASRGLLSLDRQARDGQPVDFAMAAANLRGVAIFGDNRFAAYWDYSGSRPVTSVKPFPAGSGGWELPTQSLSATTFLPRLSMLAEIISRPNGTLAVVGVPVTTTPSVTFGQARDLFTGLPETIAGTEINVSTDGTQLFMPVSQNSGSIQRGAIVVLNWFEEFRPKR